jgi:glycolate oxidase iron-sulfur subunit
MIHGQGIKEAPRELLRLIPKVEITEGLDSGVCCGSAGIYNLTHPEEGQSLGIYKAKSLLWSNPSMIASANIGCTLQIGLYTESENIPIKHPVEILNDSYCGLKTIGMLDRIFYD